MKKTSARAIICLAILLTAGCSEEPEKNGEKAEAYTTANSVRSDSSTDNMPESNITFEVITTYSEFEPPSLCFELSGAEYGNLPDGSEELFKKAIGVWCLYNINSMLCDENTAETITLPIENSSYVYYRTGISYEGFRVYLESIFTEEWVENCQKTNNTFINNYDELLCLNVAGITNEDFISITFNITEKTENIISFTGVAKYEAEDGYQYEKEFPQKMIKIDGEWRLSEFNCWY